MEDDRMEDGISKMELWPQGTAHIFEQMVDNVMNANILTR
jgi:hypothetical protein